MKFCVGQFWLYSHRMPKINHFTEEFVHGIKISATLSVIRRTKHLIAFACMVKL